MIRKSSCVAGLFALSLAAASHAQPQYPNNGYVGVYADAAGTRCCAEVARGTSRTLHLLATLAGQTSKGMTGAEFRLELSNPAGYFFRFDPYPGVEVEGRLVDDTPENTTDPRGITITLPACWWESTHGPKITLGTLEVFNAGGGPLDMVVKRRMPAQSPEYLCPLFALCDREPGGSGRGDIASPSSRPYSRACMTLTENQLDREPQAFRSSINKPCDGHCGAVSVATGSWSNLKRLFR